MNPMLLQTPKGMIESGTPNKLEMGMIPVMNELALPPVGNNYEEIRSMPVTEASNAMFMPESPAPQMPQMGDIAAMFQQQDPNLQLANSLGITDPQRQAGFSQFISGLKGIEDSYNRANLPASIYLKMKEQEDDAEIKRQSAMIQSLQLESDLNFQRQTLEMKREELAMQRQKLYGDVIKGQRISDILSGGSTPMPYSVQPTGINPAAELPADVTLYSNPQNMGVVDIPSANPLPPPIDGGLEQLKQLSAIDPENYGKMYIDALGKANTPTTEAGKLEQDFQRGLITPDQYNAGMTKITSETRKSQQESEKSSKGKETLESTLEKMRKNVIELADLGGMPSTESGTLNNLGAAASASGVGQALGRTLGTKESTIRDQIQSSRNQLLTQLMAATGMSAQMLNSNVELQNFLNSLGSDVASKEARLGIIQSLSETYGSGKTAQKVLESNKPVADIDAEIERLQKELGL